MKFVLTYFQCRMIPITTMLWDPFSQHVMDPSLISIWHRVSSWCWPEEDLGCLGHCANIYMTCGWHSAEISMKKNLNFFHHVFMILWWKKNCFFIMNRSSACSWLCPPRFNACRKWTSRLTHWGLGFNSSMLILLYYISNFHHNITITLAPLRINSLHPEFFQET